jgi:murein L,D-transpeptidase YcbB/YkuD
VRTLLSLLTMAAAGSTAFAAIPDPDVAATVDMVIASAHHPEMRWPDIRDVAPTMKGLYEAEPDRLFWFDGEAPDPALPGVVKALALADEHGLDRADYDADRLQARWKATGPGTTPAQRALFDLAVTACVSRLLSAVHVGRVDPATLSWGYDIEPKRLDRAAALVELRQLGDLGHALALREPPFSHYARAKRVLARYEKLAEPPSVPALPAGRKKLEPGQPWDGLAAVAARLRAFGDLAPGAAAGAAYDGALVDAVKGFQRRHGLEPDGVLGAGTIAT